MTPALTPEQIAHYLDQTARASGAYAAARVELRRVFADRIRKQAPATKRVERDEEGRISHVVEEPGWTEEQIRAMADQAFEQAWPDVARQIAEQLAEQEREATDAS